MTFTYKHDIHYLTSVEIRSGIRFIVLQVFQPTVRLFITDCNQVIFINLIDYNFSFSAAKFYVLRSKLLKFLTSTKPNNLILPDRFAIAQLLTICEVLARGL